MNGKEHKSHMLEPGEHYGRTHKQTRSPHVSLAEVEYDPRVRYIAHANQDALLVFVKSGGYQKSVGLTRLNCQAGDLLFVPAEYIQADSFGESRTRCLIADCSHTLIRVLRESGADLCDAVTFSGSRFSAFCVQLQQELNNADAFSPLLIEGIIFGIFATRCRHQKQRFQTGPAWLDRAKALLHDDVSQTRSIEAIAEQVGVHPAHLATEFRRHFHCSPGEYLRRNRVEQAASLLRQTRQPISEIASACGFSDQAHLSRQFSKHYGSTPFAYRRSFHTPKRVQNL